jgi:hypothetical protein
MRRTGLNNFWGEPDDIEPLPDWMDPKKCHTINEQKNKTGSVEKAAEKCLKRPPIPTQGWNYNDQ